MTNSSEFQSIPMILEQLKNPQPWQIAALLQDRLIWDSLMDKAFLARVAHRLNRVSIDPQTGVAHQPTYELSPAVFALDAIGYPELIDSLRTNATDALPSPLLQVIELGEVQTAASSGPVQALQAAGLRAIVLHQQMTRNPGSAFPAWENLIEELPHCATALACLYGMLPKPASLLSALLKTAPRQPRALQLICHVLLSNPLKPDALQTIFQRLLTQAGLVSPALAAAPSNIALDMVDVLSEMRPESGAQLAGWLAAEMPPVSLIEAMHPAAVIPALLARAKLHQLNSNPEQAAYELSRAANQANLLVTELQTVQVSELRHNLDNTRQALEQLDLILVTEEPRPHPWIIRQRTNHLNNLAGYLLEAGFPDKALEAARMMRERASGNANVHYLAGASLLAQSRSNTNHSQNSPLLEAIHNLELAAALDPHNIEKLRRLAEAYVTAKQFEEGLAVHERILAEAELCQEVGLMQDLIALGRCAIQAGHPLRAIQAANQALAILEENPGDGQQVSQAYALLGNAHQALEDFKTAIPNLQLAVQNDPINTTAWLDLAACAAASGNEGLRIETLTTAVQALPNQVEIHLALGNALFDQEFLTEAQESFTTAYELCDKACNSGLRHQVCLANGRALLALNHQATAGRMLAEAFSLSPSDLHTAGLYGRWLLDNGQAASAAEVLGVVANAPTQDPPLALEFARALLSSGGDAQRAITALEAVLPLLGSEMEDEALGLMADAHSQLGENQAAFDIYRAVLLRSPQLDQHKKGSLSRGLGCAALALSAEQPELKEVAHAALLDAANLNAEHAPTRRYLAEAAWANGLENEAWVAARAALDLNPSLENAMWFGGQVLERFSKGKNAVSDANNAQQGGNPLFPDLVKKAIQALRACKTQGTSKHTGLPNPALLQLARLFQRASQVENAIGALRAIQNSPASGAKELEETADEFLGLGEKESALKSLELAVERSATPYQKAMLLARQSDLYSAQNKPEEAAARLYSAIEVTPFDMDLHIRLVKLHTAHHQYDQADQAAQRALEACAQCASGSEINLPMAALYSQLAELHLATGRLVQSYAHASHAIQTFTSVSAREDIDHEALGTAFSAAIQAAECLLLPGKAAALLRHAQYPHNATIEPLNTTLHCLAAQLALAENSDLEAAEILTPVLATPEIKDLPWVQTLQAMLLVHTNRDAEDILQANQLLDGVFDRYQLPEKESQARQTICPLALGALKDTALSLTLKPPAWERLVNTLQTMIASHSPETTNETISRNAPAPEANPLAGLLLVEVLVRRAEYRQLCLDLQAIQAAPLPDRREAALTFELLQNVEAALLSARQESAALTGENLVCDLDENAWAPAMQTLERWKTRAAAIFGEPLPAAWIGWETTRLAEPGMFMDAAAYLAHLRNQNANLFKPTTGSLNPERQVAAARLMPAVHQLGQAHLDQPLVQIQGALLAAGLRPDNARAFASRGLAAATTPHDQDKAQDASLAPFAFAANAQVCLRLNLFELALQSFQTALKILPDEPRWQHAAAVLLSQLSLASGKEDESMLEEAVAHLEEAIRLEPAHAPHSLVLSKIMNRLPLPEITGQGSQNDARHRALRTLERASRLQPGDAAVWLALARAQANNDFEIISQRGQKQQQASLPQGKSSAATSLVDTCARKAVELAHQTGQADLEAAALCLNGQIALKAGDAETAYRSGRQAAHLINQVKSGSALQGKEKNSSILLDEIDQLSSTSFLIQVEALEMLERYSDALEILENYLGRHSEDQEVLAKDSTSQKADDLPLKLKHAHLESLVHGPQAGIKRLEDLKSQSSEQCPQVEAALAFDLAAAGRVDEAAQQARLALSHMNSSPANNAPLSYSKDLLPLVTPAELHGLLGRLLANQGQLDQAVHHLANAVKADPGFTEAYLELAAVYNQQRQYNRALQTLEQAIKVSPQDSRPYHMAGVIYREGRDYPRAAEFLRRAASLDPDNAEIRRHLLAVMAAGFFSTANSDALSQSR